MRSVKMHNSLLIGRNIVILAYSLTNADYVFREGVGCSAALLLSKNINPLDMVVSEYGR